MLINKLIFYQKQADLLFQSSVIQSSQKSIQMVTDLQQSNLLQAH